MTPQEEQLENFEKYNMEHCIDFIKKYTVHQPGRETISTLYLARIASINNDKEESLPFFFISSVDNDEGRPHFHLHRSLFVVLLRDADKKRKT